MPIDPTGIKPGLVPTAPPVKTIHLKCRRDGCDSILAIEMTNQNNAQGHHLYRCAKCNATWGIATGGSFNI
jgi:hypothetical protein